MVILKVHLKPRVRKLKRKLVSITKSLFIMNKNTKPVNAPSTTGKPSGGGRGNNPTAPPKPKGK